MPENYKLADAGATITGAHPACLRAGEHDGDERIGIARIALKQQRHGVSALVAGFYEADRLLLAWQRAARGLVDCEFIVFFTDGASIGGMLPMPPDARAKPALWSHIRQTLRMNHTQRRLDPGRMLLDGKGRLVDDATLDDYALEQYPYNIPSLTNRQDRGLLDF